ncbi:MAG: ABC transporter substrate-binding protein [Alphaproteobacteria bacterium]
MAKEKFVIAPHMRLHEWVAEEKGYFADEGLEYEYHDELVSPDGKKHDFGDKVGAYQTFERGRSCDVSSACHWTVNAAAASGHGKLYRDAYSVAPSGIFVPPDSDIHKPEDLKDVPISVGFQSGSHYSTIQALEQWMKPEDVTLSFSDGLLFKRLELLIDRKVPAAAVFNAPYYVCELLGFRKICDTTFMITGMLTGDPDLDDVRKYYSALRRAQLDIDLRPELYTHYYLKELPERYHDMVDVRRMGPGERIVFEPYTEETFTDSQNWINERDIFEDEGVGGASYAEATISLAS